MTNNKPDQNADPTPTPRKRRGRTIFLDGPPERGNATAEELTWPVVSHIQHGRSIFIDGPPERGNATAEELTWPVVGAGGQASSTDERAETVAMIQALVSAHQHPIRGPLRERILAKFPELAATLGEE